MGSKTIKIIAGGDGAAVADTVPVYTVNMSATSIDMLKWLAVVLMVIDHINKFVFKETVPGMFALGRVAMPLFVFVLGYNLARPGVLRAGIYKRVFIRLSIFGMLSVFPHALMNGLAWGWWPANIMFTLAVAVLVAWLLDKGSPISVIGACLVFLVGGALVEFWWPAVGACLLSWAYFRRRSMLFLVGFVACLLALYFVNGNFWALAALPVIAVARAWRWTLPRLKWFFYAFYPVHFVVIWAYLRLVG
jgi:TraX protein